MKTEQQYIKDIEDMIEILKADKNIEKVQFSWSCYGVKIVPVEKDVTKLPRIETLEGNYYILDNCLEKYRMVENRQIPLFKVGNIELECINYMTERINGEPVKIECLIFEVEAYISEEEENYWKEYNSEIF